MVKSKIAVSFASSEYDDEGSSSSSKNNTDLMIRPGSVQHPGGLPNDDEYYEGEEDDDDEDEDDNAYSESNRLGDANDAPARASFAQYIDSDDDLDTDHKVDSDDSSADGSPSDDEVRPVRRVSPLGREAEAESALREKLAHVPFSALVKARRSMMHSDSGEEDEADEFDSDRQSARRIAERKAQRAIEKRESKHAPTEMSSRRPVSRRRTVIDLPGDVAGQEERRRDPRFSSLSASLPNKGVFQESYGFLRTQQADEVKLLRQTLSKLKRQEAHHAGPKARSEAALRVREERERVEVALKREEGRENERKRREHEGEVVRRANKAIDERVKQGGKRFFLKDADKKKMVLEDKFARLAGVGDGSSTRRGGLQRAVERRRKKNANKDRRIPLGGGSGGGGGGVISDAHATQDSAPLPKRKKLQGASGDAGTIRRRSNGVR